MIEVVLVHNHYDADWLEAVRAEMARRGSPTIRVIDGGGIYYAIEGSHRLRAAAASNTPVHLDVLDYNDTIDLGSLDVDTHGWFGDRRRVPVGEFVEWFMRGSFPMGHESVEVLDADDFKSVAPGAHMVYR